MYFRPQPIWAADENASLGGEFGRGVEGCILCVLDSGRRHLRQKKMQTIPVRVTPAVREKVPGDADPSARCACSG